VAVESVDALSRHHVHTVELVLAQAPAEGTFALPDVEVAGANGAEVRLLVRGDLNPLLRRLASLEVIEMALTTPDLEDLFLTYYQAAANVTERGTR
jgi:ABC-2 type transport system ATP-binding protein